ncbi:hypothetical protein DXT66_13765 [Nocardia farcinica]|nr:hypothetical protein DXT66_13765 [Nocardia farcinica]
MIWDPDGWLDKDAPPFWEPVTEDEFLHRFFRCTTTQIAESGRMREYQLALIERNIEDRF